MTRSARTTGSLASARMESKVCRQYGGEITSAEGLNRQVSRADEDDVRNFIREHLPNANGRLLRSKVCMNTNTPDKHFVIGFHPASERIILAGGFCGHGYKFVPVIGEILADLATRGT